MLSVVSSSGILLSVILLSIIMLNHFTNPIITLSVILLRIVVLNVIQLNVITQSVITYSMGKVCFHMLWGHYAKRCYAYCNCSEAVFLVVCDPSMNEL